MNAGINSRNISVDALRFLCAIGIVIHHTLGAFLPENNPILTINRYSFVYSVNIFFAISGYAISESLKNYHPTILNAVKYMIRRSIRLDSPYWFMLALYFFVETALHQRNYGLIDSIANAFYMQRIFGFTPIIGVAWTLCIEVQFYLYMLVLASFRYVLRITKLIHLAILATAVLGRLFFNEFNDGNYFLEYFSWFLVGILATDHTVNNLPKQLLLATLVLMVPCFTVTDNIADYICTFVYGISTYLLVSGSVVRLRTIANSFHHLGAYTYSIYLTHMFSIKAVASIGAIRYIPLQFIGAVILTTVLSILLHYGIEKPSLQLSRKISYRD
jgi:peptidoglycan/LPS O-acetylase OafA/YrhL